MTNTTSATQVRTALKSTRALILERGWRSPPGWHRREESRAVTLSEAIEETSGDYAHAVRFQLQHTMRLGNAVTAAATQADIVALLDETDARLRGEVSS